MASKKITTTNELNEALVGCLEDIMGVGASSKGNNFDETVGDKLRNHLAGAKYVSTEQWCSTDTNSIYFDFAGRTIKNKFDFSDLPQIIDNGVPLDLMIIDKPNGSQKWPDFLVVFQGVGLPIEIKSSKADAILWNSGMPRADSLYIYNCYGKSKTTCFLGQHAITEDELQFLLLKSKLSEELNEKHPNKKWSYYVRDMFNSTQKFFENNENKKNCKRYMEKIQEHEKEIELLKGSTNKRDLLKIEKLNGEVHRLTELYCDLDNEYKKQVRDRERVVGETLDYINKLPWSKEQKTDFNFKLNETLEICQIRKLKP